MFFSQTVDTHWTSNIVFKVINKKSSPFSQDNWSSSFFFPFPRKKRKNETTEYNKRTNVFFFSNKTDKWHLFLFLSKKKKKKKERNFLSKIRSKHLTFYHAEQHLQRSLKKARSNLLVIFRYLSSKHPWNEHSQMYIIHYSWAVCDVFTFQEKIRKKILMHLTQWQSSSFKKKNNKPKLMINPSSSTSQAPNGWN